MYTKKGKVIIVGAGPGDPELIAVKAVRFLQQADVVLVDRLVSYKIIDEYISPDAIIIPVGKQRKKGASTPQVAINALMVEYAKQGKLVVRLKGGDVSVFSNILDELETLTLHQISYEIIPGITAALGAAAYSGIPLTARGYSNSVRFLTYYKSDVVADDHWKELAATSDTLVFYMSAETLPVIIKKLTAHHIDHEKKLAVVEQATTPNQQIIVSDMYEYEEKFSKQKLISPAILIIGRVVSLHEQFKWLQNNTTDEEYFAPVAAKLVAYKEDEKIKILTA